MFQNSHYMTKGVAFAVPPETVLLLWQMVAEMPEPKDYLQIFRLSVEGGRQTVRHEQEQPPYSRTVCFSCSQPVNAKVYVIDDENHSTMLLAEEY